MEKLQNIYKVVSNEKLCPQFYRLCIDAKPLLKVKPGQFLHLKVNDGLEPFFRRPFSVYRAKKHIEIFYEVVGRGTAELAAKRKGDGIDVLGPVGTPFSRPPKNAKQIVMVAGGIGIAPFLILSDVLKKNKNCEVILLYGGRTKGHVYEMKEFRQNGVKVYISTDDGSVGVRGRVSKLFKHIDKNPDSTFIYTCGPNPMMAAVQEFANKHNIEGEVACEEVMACALGACLGCSIPTTNGYKTVCYDGPVFDLQEVKFEEMLH